ncbi:MAG: hypothetical protein U0L05_01380 [Schaedlerella sp.]|nr:hypothetical protein [Schaedlerella sp.]
MNYKVLDVFPVGKNTSVTIEGNGIGLKNNMIIGDSLGVAHKLISVAMVAGQSTEETGKTTTLLVEGNFDSKIVRL